MIAGWEDEAASVTVGDKLARERAAVAVRWAERRSWVGSGHWSTPSRPAAGTVRKSSCTRAQRAGSAQGTAPSGLPASKVVLGCLSHWPDALTCHPRRGKPASTGRGGVPKALEARRWPAVMAPRRAGLPADDVVASHRAVGGAGPSIKPARTYAHFISRGAVARVRVFQSAGSSVCAQGMMMHPRGPDSPSLLSHSLEDFSKGPGLSDHVASNFHLSLKFSRARAALLCPFAPVAK
eukprot:COSAG06_NODE_7095_length_2637_cov_2.256107_2_plen_237_part_00